MTKKQIFKKAMYILIYNNPGLIAWPLAMAITIGALFLFEVK